MNQRCNNNQGKHTFGQRQFISQAEMYSEGKSGTQGGGRCS